MKQRGVVLRHTCRMNTETTTPIDEGRCPICGGDNQCGVHGAEPCWCTRVHFSAELLARVPAHLRGRACICKSCIPHSGDDKTRP